MELPTLKPNKGIDPKGAPVDAVEGLSKFHMGGWDLCRMDKALNAYHDYFIMATNYNHKSVDALLMCWSALREAVIILEYAYHKKGRKELDNHVDGLKAKISEVRRIMSAGGAINDELYYQIHDDLHDTAKMIYRIKQENNLGIPKEKADDPLEAIKEAME